MKKLFLLFAFLFSAAVLTAQERILSFDALAELHPDGTVDITETITVRAEHRDIKRGIYRDIPLRSTQKINIRSLEMDGREHPYFTENTEEGKRINFGNDSFITRGLHTYKLSYTMRNVIGRFKDYDEIYWNATGNGWIFPIERARAEVVLPEEAEVLEPLISAYTGAYGSKRNTSIRRGLIFQTRHPLQPGEGLTVAVPFQKGLIPLTFPEKLRPFAAGAIILLALLLTAMTAFYAITMWKKVGKDPQARVIRQFAPPENISAPYARYIRQMCRADLKLLSIFFCSLAMKGGLSIKETRQGRKRSFVIQKKQPQEKLLTNEQYVWKNMPKSLTIDGSYNTEIEQLYKKITKYLSNNTNSRTLFARNTLQTQPFFTPAYTFLFLFFIQFILFERMPFIFSLLLLSGTFGLIKVSISPVLLLSLGLRRAMCGCAYALLLSGFLYPHTPLFLWWWPLAFIVTWIAAKLAAKVMPAYSVRGRQIMDQIEGFLQYLSVAEAGRTAASDPTDQLKIFCDYLPYALALDVENKWIKRFEKTVGEALLQQEAAQRGFYISTGFVSALSAINSAGSRATVKPSENSGRGGSHFGGGGFSGSGGGGFSGGGFGGGGGGGR